MLRPDLLNGELSFGKMLLADLDEQVKAVLLQISDLPLGSELVRFLDANRRTYLTADDIAFRVGQSPELVEKDLGALVRLGVAERTLVSGITLYHLTSQPRKRRAVGELIAWQERWDGRLNELRHRLLGLPPNTRDSVREETAHIS